MRLWVISAACSVDGFGKVSEQSEHNVLTFKTVREGEIIITFLMTQISEKGVLMHELKLCLGICKVMFEY